MPEPIPFPDEPIHAVVWRPAEELHANCWNPNRVFKPELRLLRDNLLGEGWLQAILVTPSGLIIDGFHRWTLSTTDKAVMARWRGQVPTIVRDIGDDEAMALTVRMNRAKGTHIATAMHELVSSLATDYGWTVERIGAAIGANRQEVELLCRDGVFAAKGIAQWAYSPAWYPAEGRTEALVAEHSRDAAATKMAEEVTP